MLLNAADECSSLARIVISRTDFQQNALLHKYGACQQAFPAWDWEMNWVQENGIGRKEMDWVLKGIRLNDSWVGFFRNSVHLNPYIWNCAQVDRFISTGVIIVL